MPRKAKTLSMVQIRKLPRGLHAVGDGLVVRLGAQTRRWLLRRYLDGKQREFDLGGLDDMTLEQAHAAADALRVKLLKRKGAKLRQPAEEPPPPELPEIASDSDNPFLGPIARAALVELAL